MLTDEQFNTLAPFEKVFLNALNSNFIRVTGSDFNVIASVYDQLFHPLRPSQRSCNSCRLNAIKTMAKAFFEEKARREVEEEALRAAAAKKAEQKAEEKPAKLAAKKPQTKNKGGRPKKIKLED